MMKNKLVSLFAGVGGIDLGFTQTGKFQTVYANDFDKYTEIQYNVNNKNKLILGDIHEIKLDNIPDCDIIVGGFPCQAFSIAGKRLGFKDPRGTLFFEMLRIIKAKQPKVVFIENVSTLLTHDKGQTFKTIEYELEQVGYYIKYKVMNTKDYGNIPQNRNRIYIVCFKDKKMCDMFTFPNKIPLITKLSDLIYFDKKVPDKYYYTADKCKFYQTLVNEVNDNNTVYQWRRTYVRKNKSNVCPTLTANMGTGGNNVPIIYNYNSHIRKLTPRECFNLQGFPLNFKLSSKLSDTQLYKQAGNSVTVPVIKRIAENIAEVL